jgi:hypothetical protein
VQLAKEELKNYRGDADMAAQIREEHGNELRLVTLATATEKQLTGLRKRDSLLDKTDSPDRLELKKAIAERRKALMAHFNKRYADAISAE